MVLGVVGTRQKWHHGQKLSELKIVSFMKKLSHSETNSAELSVSQNFHWEQVGR